MQGDHLNGNVRFRESDVEAWIEKLVARGKRGELAVEIIYKYGLWPFNEKRQCAFTAMASAKGQTWVRESRTD
jgi:hypothetical protein